MIEEDRREIDFLVSKICNSTGATNSERSKTLDGWKTIAASDLPYFLWLLRWQVAWIESPKSSKVIH